MIEAQSNENALVVKFSFSPHEMTFFDLHFAELLFFNNIYFPSKNHSSSKAQNNSHKIEDQSIFHLF